MKKFAVGLILLAGILWGSLVIFVRRLDAYGLDSMSIVFLRAIVTSVFMLVILAAFRPQLLKIRLKDTWCFLGTGVMSIAFFNFCYFKAITLTSLSVAAVLLYTAPMIVMVISRLLFKEKITKRKLFALVITFAGCILVTGIAGENAPVSVVGILAGLGAGIGYALYSIFSRYALQKGYHSLTITFYTFLTASIVTAFGADIPKVGKTMTAGPSAFLLCAALGVVCTVLPYLTYTLGLKYVENGRASVIASIEPVVATAIGILVFHEKLSGMNLVGMLLVLGALVIMK